MQLNFFLQKAPLCRVYQIFIPEKIISLGSGLERFSSFIERRDSESLLLHHRSPRLSADPSYPNSAVFLDDTEIVLTVKPQPAKRNCFVSFLLLMTSVV